MWTELIINSSWWSIGWKAVTRRTRKAFRGLQEENEEIKQGSRYDCVERRQNKQGTETRKDAGTICLGNWWRPRRPQCRKKKIIKIALMEGNLKRSLEPSGCAGCGRGCHSSRRVTVFSTSLTCARERTQTHTLNSRFITSLPPLLLPEGRLLTPLILNPDSSIWHESEAGGQSLIRLIYLFVILQPR